MTYELPAHQLEMLYLSRKLILSLQSLISLWRYSFETGYLENGK